MLWQKYQCFNAHLPSIFAHLMFRSSTKLDCILQNSYHSFSGNNSTSSPTDNLSPSTTSYMVSSHSPSSSESMHASMHTRTILYNYLSHWPPPFEIGSQSLHYSLSQKPGNVRNVIIAQHLSIKCIHHNVGRGGTFLGRGYLRK